MMREVLANAAGDEELEKTQKISATGELASGFMGIVSGRFGTAAAREVKTAPYARSVGKHVADTLGGRG
jgi:hypothetical protein